MKNLKRFALAAAGLLMSAAGFSQAKEIPYSSGLCKDTDWQTVNANDDAKTWAADESSYSYSDTGFPSGVKYSYNTSEAADDWYISPAISLEAGKEYKVKFWHKTGYDNESYALYAATSNTPEALKEGNVISKYDDQKNSTWLHDVKTFTPEESGDYYFGFYAYSAKNKYYICLTGFAIGENVFTPGAPGGFTVTAGENKAVSATLSWTLPTADDDGVPFADGVTIEKVEVFRDGESVATLGADATTWTDSEELGLTPGFHNYEVQVTANGKAGLKAAAKSPYIGPLQAMPIPWDAGIKDMTEDDFKLFFTVFNTENSESTSTSSSYPERKFWYLYASSYSDNYLYKYPQSKKKDDWIVSPPLKFENAGGYRVIINAKSSSSSKATNTNVYFSSGYGADEFSEATKIGTIHANGTASDYILYFNVTTSGEYNLAIQELDTEGDTYYGDYIYSIKIEEALDYPTNISGLTADVEGENVKLTWTNPAKTVLGNDIAKLTKVEIYRGDAESATAVLTEDVYLTGGAMATYTDTPDTTGVISYRVVPYLGEYAPEDDMAQVYSGWVGDDTQALPYLCKFDDPKYYSLWKSHDLDSDSDTWGLSTSGAKLSLSKGAEANVKDELTSAPFDLSSGYYEISFNGNASSMSGKSLTMGMVKADAEDPTAFAASKQVEFSSSYYNNKYSAILKIDEAGKYRMGFLYDGQGASTSGKTLTLNDISLKAYPVLPGVATDLTATVAENGVMEVSLAWTNPNETNMEGLNLAEITKAVVSRKYITGNGDFVEIAEMTEGLLPGETTSYTDKSITESGEYEYRVDIYNTDGKSTKAGPRVATGWVGKGLSVPYYPEDFNAWHIYNVNGDVKSYDDYDYEVTWEATYNGEVQIASTSTVADDWLISPPLNIEEGNKYAIAIKHRQTYGSSIDFDLHAGLSTHYEGMTTHVATLSTEEERYTDKEDIIKIIGTNPESLTESASLYSVEDPEYIKIPAGATSFGLHANSKCDMKIKSFKVDILSGVEGITDSETLVPVEGIGLMPANCTDIRVFDLAGKLLVKARNTTELHKLNLGKGVYMLTATSNGKRFCRKFIK